MIFKKVIIILLLILIVEIGLTMLAKSKQERVCVKYGMMCIKTKDGLYQEQKICKQYAILEDEK